MIEARPGESLDHAMLFDEGCVKTRLNELTVHFTAQFVKEDLDSLVLEYRQQFKDVPQYPLSEIGIREKFGEKARAEALRILEEERKNLVDYQSEKIKGILQQVIKRFRYAVHNIDEKGKVSKLQIIIEKVPTFSNSKNSPDMRDTQYVGDHDFSRFDEIMRLKDRLNHFSDYVPYFNEELSKLWKEASELGNLEIVRKEDMKEIAKAQETTKTEKAEVQEAT